MSDEVDAFGLESIAQLRGGEHVHVVSSRAELGSTRDQRMDVAAARPRHEQEATRHTQPYLGMAFRTLDEECLVLSVRSSPVCLNGSR